MSKIQKVDLDTTQRCPDAIEFEARMRDRVVGQDEAIEKLSWLVQTFMAGFSAKGRPAGVLLFLGPTGSEVFRTQHSAPHLFKTWSPPPLTPSALSPFYCHWKLQSSPYVPGNREGAYVQEVFRWAGTHFPRNSRCLTTFVGPERLG